MKMILLVLFFLSCGNDDHIEYVPVPLPVIQHQLTLQQATEWAVRLDTDVWTTMALWELAEARETYFLDMWEYGYGAGHSSTVTFFPLVRSRAIYWAEYYGYHSFSNFYWDIWPGYTVVY